MFFIQLSKNFDYITNPLSWQPFREILSEIPARKFAKFQLNVQELK